MLFRSQGQGYTGGFTGTRWCLQQCSAVLFKDCFEFCEDGVDGQHGKFDLENGTVADCSLRICISCILEPAVHKVSV